MIAIQGALNVDNFGDVLLGRLFSNWVKEAGGDVIAPFSTEVTRAQMGIPEAGHFAQADALLYIGGGYFGEPDRSFLGKWRWGFRMIRNHLFPASGFVFGKRPIAIIGVGCGNVTNLIARVALIAITRFSSKILVRDLESQRFLRRNGAGAKVQLTADAVLSLTGAPLAPEAVLAAQRIDVSASGRPIVVLHLDQQSATDPQWNLLIETIVGWCQSHQYYTIFATDQNNTPPSKKQLIAYQSFINRISNSSTYEYSGVDDMIGLLSTAALVITTKLHVGIVSATQGTPAFSFATHPKTMRLYSQLGVSERCLPVSQWDEASIRHHLSAAADAIGKTTEVPAQVVALAARAKSEVISFVQEIKVAKTS